MNGISRSLFFLKWKERGGGWDGRLEKQQNPAATLPNPLLAPFAFLVYITLI